MGALGPVSRRVHGCNDRALGAFIVTAAKMHVLALPLWSYQVLDMRAKISCCEYQP